MPDPTPPTPGRREAAEALVRAYYAAFSAGDRAAMCALLADGVVHDVNQGGRRTGLAAFRAFLAQMDAAYEERLEEVVVMADATGTRAAAEFLVVGRYLRSEPGLPEARGQAYRLPAGAFLAIAEGKITRVTTYYNLQEWIRQVSA
ncbi:ketosteroid isomerase-related protein [Falsiroseomonas oryzae]|uniref:ketosteroid isomerase-related protein n=1 Tax=Falsiroseomonas oryzae TaxID=2766473 RepID=UPI0022EA7AD7|nr:ketosteroid isomerase-related protein [Roseomonas sp. MO-31]